MRPTILSKLFRWKPSREILTPIVAGLIVLGLSALMDPTTFRIGNSAFIIYPFFWGVGGVYDVLVQSQKVLPVLYPGVRSLYLGILIIALLAWIIRSGSREKFL